MTIKAIVFDAYGTLYDVQSVADVTEDAFRGYGGIITQVWRIKQLEYTWLRSLMRHYRDFSEVTRDSPYNLHSSVLKTGFTTPQYLSDYYVEDGSFLRLDNVAAGYSFNYRGQPMRITGTVQNVFTITGYSGVDPTAGLYGLDNNIYPRSRTFTGGLSVRF